MIFIFSFLPNTSEFSYGLLQLNLIIDKVSNVVDVE